MDLYRLNLVKLANGGKALGQLSLVPQLPVKMMLDPEVVKKDSKNNLLASLV